jgi:hypothetical protein
VTAGELVGDRYRYDISAAPPFSVHGTSINSPSQPLGFTAAFPQREIQVGIHFDF